MTKAEIVEMISRANGIDREEAMKCVEGFMEEVKKSLGKGENVYLRGFGTFLLKTRAEKKARNITAGTEVIVPEHNIPAFKPADTFMEVVKNGRK